MSKFVVEALSEYIESKYDNSIVNEQRTFKVTLI